ncbi:RraA family protein [Cupriavidus plantarum]|uniref:RraA family protein n=1 Tax=Cupriavidus plantarum TaxID=942865 RepID=UPI0015C794D2|nr:RraA family protein [Cupriavidus plantarum]NYI00928.1 regulator of RNase E activity RraA [Cupriavidus plantarum]CAG2134774.1 4-hydroxy-4-methyl-2-oxoglutarate aldolase/4-carboxy-4-hydroxy-2-oxoadipate aldolase [Cupriavidus plantarum]SMR84465.1 Regulator of RNase E activity RraA [Cupriavidus plantarum]
MSASQQLPDVVRDIERVSPEVVRQASQYASSIFADVAGRRGGLHGRIAPLSQKSKFCGPAITVEVRPGDNLMIHAAMALAKPGDVIIVDGKGDQNSALMGAIMVNQCIALGVAAVVLDAAARDAEEIIETGFPMYSVGLNPNGPTKFVPGRVNHPIQCGGVTVCPGDLVIGDADGVVVIEREKAPALIEEAGKKVAAERKRIEGIKSGEALRPSWLDDALRAAGVLKAGEAL